VGANRFEPANRTKFLHSGAGLLSERVRFGEHHGICSECLPGRANANADANSNRNSNANANSDSNTDCVTNRHANGNCDPNRYANGDRDSDRYADTNGYGDSDSHGDTNRHSNAHCRSVRDADTQRITICYTYSNTRLLRKHLNPGPGIDWRQCPYRRDDRDRDGE
jgi:hypothetical protein